MVETVIDPLKKSKLLREFQDDIHRLHRKYERKLVMVSIAQEVQWLDGDKFQAMPGNIVCFHNHDTAGPEAFCNAHAMFHAAQDFSAEETEAKKCH